MESYESHVDLGWIVCEYIAGSLNILNILLILFTIIRLMIWPFDKIKEIDIKLRYINMICIGLVLALNIAGIVNDCIIHQDIDTDLIDVAIVVAAITNLLSYYFVITLFRLYNTRSPVKTQEYATEKSLTS